LYRDISEKGYRPRTNIVKDEKSDLVTDSHSILARWRNHYSQLLSVLGVNDVRQTKIHTAEPQVPEPSAFEVELAIEKLKSHESACIDQIPAELIKVGEQFVMRSINLFILFGIRRNRPRNGRSGSLYVPIHKKGDKTDCSNFRGISLSPSTYKILSNILLSRLIPYAEEIIGDHQCGFRRNR